MKRKVSYKQEIGRVIARLRLEKGLTQTELAERVGTSQSAIHRIENGQQNVSLEMIKRLSDCLDGQILSINDNASQSYKIRGGKELSGEIRINTSKNAAVGLLCASLLNKGRTVLKGIAKIEEVYRIIEVLNSIGVSTRFINKNHDLEIISSDEYLISNMNIEAARRTRSIIMFLGPLLNFIEEFKIPYAGGCSLGVRTVDPHLKALKSFGLNVDATSEPGYYKVKVDREANKADKGEFPKKKIVLIERGDTVTENVLMAAAMYPGETEIVGASSNYMVQDVCFYLEELGVKIQGVGTTRLIVQGVRRICRDVEYSVSEDPIEAMSFIAAGLVTKSAIKILRAPIEFLEIELEVLRSMGAEFSVSSEYLSKNGRTRLVDISLKKSKLIAPVDKIHPMPFPGLNIDNLPFFSVIAAVSEGRTLIHDWVFENRAIYATELTKLNAKVELLDAHRVYIEGPTNWHPAELMAPPALRPSVVILIAMLAADGTSVLRNVYSIKRGYQDFAQRLRKLGADIKPLMGI